MYTPLLHSQTPFRALPSLARIPLDLLVPGPNARAELPDIGPLAESLRARGQQVPVIACPLGDGRYEILDGHRRRAAAILAGLPHLDALLRRRPDAADRLIRQLAIHSHVHAFDPIAEAHALHALMWRHDMTREQIAEAVGRSPAWVRDRIVLLELDEQDRQRVSTGRLPIAHALVIAKANLAARTGRSRPRPRPAKTPRTPASRRQLPSTASSPSPEPSPTPTAHCSTCTCFTSDAQS